MEVVENGTNRPVLVILRGLQASGKSTWAREWVAEDRANRVRINRDDLRSMIDDGVFLKGITEARILAARDALIRDLLRRGLSVVVDDTNLAARHVKDLARIAHQGAYSWGVQDFTDVPLDECIKRDLARSYPLKEGKNYVGKSVITETYNRYLKGRKLPLPVPSAEELQGQPEAGTVQPYIPPAGGIPAIIVDIDGTVALRGTRDPFDETRVSEDQPNIAVVRQVRRDIKDGLWPVFCSGRTEKCWVETTTWLWEHVLYGLDISMTLLMRATDDTRKDSVVKLELFNNSIRNTFDIWHVYDDRNQVVQMWRSLGLQVFQVADGAF